jgi:hypothetical protein
MPKACAQRAPLLEKILGQTYYQQKRFELRQHKISVRGIFDYLLNHIKRPKPTSTIKRECAVSQTSDRVHLQSRQLKKQRYLAEHPRHSLVYSIGFGQPEFAHLIWPTALI